MPLSKEAGTARTKTRLCEWGSSRAVRIPKRMCETTGIAIGSELDMQTGHDNLGDFIVIRPSAQHRSYGNAPYISMDELFSDYDGSFVPTELDWGCDVGAEVVE